MVVCGVALVSLSTVRAASAQPSSGSCFGSGGGSGINCVQFEPGHQEHRVDYGGGHSFKIIADVTTKFFLEVDVFLLSPPGPTARYPDVTESCIPYVNATSDTSFGSCALYDVTAFDENGNELDPDEADQYVDGKMHYRIAWDLPTLSSIYDNPRGLRAEDSISPFFDITDGVFPTLLSGEDPGVDMSADGFSQYIVVHQPHGNALAGCILPLNCSNPTNPAANIFNAGQTVPVKVVPNPQNNSADIRLTYTGPDGLPHLAEAAGKSNQDNMFRRTGQQFLFNWKTMGLAPGIYQLTISPGTNSGDLFAPKTIMVTLQ